MAGITADTNESAGGANLGFANPFIYQEAGSGDFPDIKQGNNSNGTGSLWPAANGFDMVTGRGSVKGAAFAASARRVHAAVITFDTTKLTATHPTNLKRVKKGSRSRSRASSPNTTAATRSPTARSS